MWCCQSFKMKLFIKYEKKNKERMKGIDNIENINLIIWNRIYHCAIVLCLSFFFVFPFLICFQNRNMINLAELFQSRLKHRRKANDNFHQEDIKYNLTSTSLSSCFIQSSQWNSIGNILVGTFFSIHLRINFLNV